MGRKPAPRRGRSHGMVHDERLALLRPNNQLDAVNANSIDC